MTTCSSIYRQSSEKSALIHIKTMFLSVREAGEFARIAKKMNLCNRDQIGDADWLKRIVNLWNTDRRFTTATATKISQIFIGWFIFLSLVVNVQWLWSSLHQTTLGGYSSDIRQLQLADSTNHFNRKERIILSKWLTSVIAFLTQLEDLVGMEVAIAKHSYYLL